MSFRLSPYKFVLVAVIVALWSCVFWQPETRDLLGEQLYLMKGRYPRSLAADVNLNRAEDRIVDADYPDGRKHSPLDKYPQDVALLAICVRGGVSDIPSVRRYDGPLMGMAHWSIVTERFASNEAPLAAGIKARLTPAEILLPAPDQINYYLSLIERGQKLEPQNTFWAWMKMTVLIKAKRDREVDEVLRYAVKKNDFDDHVSDSLLASRKVSSRRMPAPAARLDANLSLLLHHASALRSTASFLAQRTMGLQLQGRDKEAVNHGLRAMRLARIMRLKASTAWVSHLGAEFEILLMSKAHVPINRPIQPNGGGYLQGATAMGSSPLVALANDPDSLLFLGKKHSPKLATEIATEWQRVARWRVASSGNSVGDLISNRELERLGWTQLITIYLMMSLPAALVFWFASTVFCKSTDSSVRTHQLSAMFGVVVGGMWLGVLLLCDFLPYRELCNRLPWQGFVTHHKQSAEDIVMLADSCLVVPRLLWGGATLMLLWVAAWQKTAPLPSAPARRIEDWERPTLDSLPFQMLGRIKVILRWWGLRGIPVVLFMGSWAYASLFLMTWESDSERGTYGSLVHIALLLVSLVVLPLLAINLRRAVEERAEINVSRFLGRARILISGYLVASIFVLPFMLFFQSQLQQEFIRQFEPIEQGQMVREMQRKRGLPME